MSNRKHSYIFSAVIMTFPANQKLVDAILICVNTQTISISQRILIIEILGYKTITFGERRNTIKVTKSNVRIFLYNFKQLDNTS